ncbi:MAG: MBOAT family protein [Chitinophagaceae bacterium]|nr:MAG: MBOAT family protein [Chitinophagaceae bacterium]
MLFNSLDFAIFLPLVFMAYWLLNKDLRSQNLLLLLSSYFFYGWWDWKFLILILISTITDFFIGKNIHKANSKKTKKIFLFFSLLINLGILGFFKYFNFFVENFIQSFTLLGFDLHSPLLNIVLPVGISFYTFQTLSYTIDIYRGKIAPTNNFLAFSVFVAFFPQLVAGPIERAGNLLPQFLKNRVFNYSYAVDGLRQILWGFFKKMVIADNLAIYVHMVYSNPESYSGWEILFINILFGLQIYCDFSGYSDIAIGTAKLFGFELRKNFAFPYFSRDVAEFWRRWHISLTTWFRDYVFIPLGGSRGSALKVIRNVFIVFLISGFWHGANWTFIFWGLYNALLFIPLLILNKHRQYKNTQLSFKGKETIVNVFNILITFLLISIGWIFFRAEDIFQSFYLLHRIFEDLLSLNSIFALGDFILSTFGLLLVLLTSFLIIIEWFGKENNHALEKLYFDKPRYYRWGLYSLIFFLIYFYQSQSIEFIYFQF